METIYSMRQEVMPPTLLKCRIDDPKPIGDISGNVPDEILESISVDVLRHISVSFMDPKVQKDFLEWKMRKNKAIKKKNKKLEKSQSFFRLSTFVFSRTPCMRLCSISRTNDFCSPSSSSRNH